MNYLDKNLKKFPELSSIFEKVDAVPQNLVEKARDGSLTIKFEDKYLHSAYRPIDEAKKLIDTYELDDAPIIVLGFAFGYHVLELLKRCPGRKIIVVERNLAVLKTAMEAIDFSGIEENIQFFTDSEAQAIVTNSEFYSALNKKPTIVVHRPSTFGFIQFYQNLSDTIISMDDFNLGKRLKVSVISPMMGGSYSVSKYVENSLAELGVEVDYVDNAPFYQMYQEIQNRDCTEEERRKSKEVFFRFMTDSIDRKIDIYKPDLVFALAQAPMSVKLLNSLNKRGIKTAFWFVENYKHMHYWQYMAAHYDYFFTIQKGEFFNKLEQSGLRNYYYLPMAASPTIHQKSIQSSLIHDITMIGTGYDNRVKFTEKVIELDPTLDLKIWGDQWNKQSKVYSRVQDDGRRLEIGEMFDTYNQSKIVVNQHSSVSNDDNDYVNPRTFELAAMGVFQLVDHREILADYFEIGKEIVTFKDEEDFVKKAKYYLKNDRERNEIAMNARNKVLGEHTYKARLTAMLSRVFGVGVMKALNGYDECVMLNQEKTDRKQVESVQTNGFSKDKAVENLCAELIREQKLNS